MNMDMSSTDLTYNQKNITGDLFGGLSILPYGIFLLLSAYAFAQGWLNWETNNGPPFLGGVLAWSLDGLIQIYYRKRYNFSFRKENVNEKKTNRSGGILLFILLIIGFLITWYVDVNFDLHIRLTPLLFGIWVCVRGTYLLKKGWKGYGAAHLALGLIPIGVGIVPFIFNFPANNLFFGFEGVYELAAMGIVVLMVSIMEHFIFVNLWNSGLIKP